MTLVDCATRYPEAIPLKTRHSRAIAEALVSVFARVGLPDEIVWDQGATLIGKLMTQFFDIKTSVYHPEANGLVELFNGTLNSAEKIFRKSN